MRRIKTALRIGANRLGPAARGAQGVAGALLVSAGVTTINGWGWGGIAIGTFLLIGAALAGGQ